MKNKSYRRRRDGFKGAEYHLVARRKNGEFGECSGWLGQEGIIGRQK